MFEKAPWITTEALERDGWAAICKIEVDWCTSEARKRAATDRGVLIHEIEIASRYLGSTGPTRRFLILIVPPRASR
jgi:hypothetical protein